MTSECQDPSRRKHRRSSADESEEPSKRRKHRQHHRHHRHHRHSSRKHDEHEANFQDDTKLEDETKQEGHDTTLNPPGPASNSSWRPDYDMEEGEIIEDEGFCAANADIEKRKMDSDAESGEINAIEVHCESDKHNMGVHEGRVEIDLGSSLPVESNNVAKVGRYPMTLREGNGNNGLMTNATVGRKENISDCTKIHDEADSRRNPSLDRSVNGDMGREPFKLDSSHNPRSRSPEGSGKRKSWYDDEIEKRNPRKSLSSENAGKRQKNSPTSSIHERHHDEVHKSNRSRSRDRTRERSRSQSLFQDASLVQSHRRDATYYTDRKHNRDSDEERMSRHNRDYRHGSRDLLRDKERERSSSYSRHTGRVDRHHSQEIREKDKEGSRDTWDRHREGRDRDRDRKNEKERERERESTRERENEI